MLLSRNHFKSLSSDGHSVERGLSPFAVLKSFLLELLATYARSKS
ncbi:hypothetical protein [Herminiimonas arsenitoxidans]|nr:hypothetical protein [Herminiimonas arsenitoxidans]